MTQKVIDNVAVLITPQAMMQAIDDNFDELYANDANAISDEAYDATTWDAVTTVAPSKNAVRDKVAAMDAAIEVNTAKVSFDSTSSGKLDGIEEGAEVNNMTDGEVGALTESGNTTLHYHSTDRDRANHTGTQTTSTISDFSSAVAANSAVSANTAKETNVSTNLAEGTATTTTVTITSSDGTDATLASASTTRAGLLTKAKFDEISAGAASYTTAWK